MDVMRIVAPVCPLSELVSRTDGEYTRAVALAAGLLVDQASEPEPTVHRIDHDSFTSVRVTRDELPFAETCADLGHSGYLRVGHIDETVTDLAARIVPTRESALNALSTSRDITSIVAVTMATKLMDGTAEWCSRMTLHDAAGYVARLGAYAMLETGAEVTESSLYEHVFPGHVADGYARSYLRSHRGIVRMMGQMGISYGGDCYTPQAAAKFCGLTYEAWKTLRVAGMAPDPDLCGDVRLVSRWWEMTLVAWRRAGVSV